MENDGPKLNKLLDDLGGKKNDFNKCQISLGVACSEFEIIITVMEDLGSKCVLLLLEYRVFVPLQN